MKIKVLKRDIENGKKSSPCYCPVALAIKRYTKSKQVIVGKNEIIVSGKKAILDNAQAKKLQKFITKFDKNKKVSGFYLEFS